MRVLHLSPELPYAPGGNGGQTREFHVCRRLVERGHDVLALSPVTRDAEDRIATVEEAGVRVWAVRRPASKAAEVARAALREAGVGGALVTQPFLAWQMRVFWTVLRARARRAVEEQRPDVVLVDHDMAAAWARDLPPGLPAVLTCHNLSWHMYRSRARVATGARAALFRAEAARYRAFVLRELPRYDTAIAVSTRERDELARIDRTRVAFIPSGVDVAALRPRPDAPPVADPPRVLFTGTMSYGPNHEGIAWFVDRVWPAVRRAVPEAELDVVGRTPPPSVTRLGERPGVHVVGAVPDMTPYFARATAVVVPILTGAGIRIKIIEALSAGRATVSTSVGAEGLALEPGRHLLVADGADAFAAATVRLLREDGLRRGLEREGQAVAERQYDWRALGDDVEETLRTAANRGAGGG